MEMRVRSGRRWQVQDAAFEQSWPPNSRARASLETMSTTKKVIIAARCGNVRMIVAFNTTNQTRFPQKRERAMGRGGIPPFQATGFPDWNCLLGTPIARESIGCRRPPR